MHLTHLKINALPGIEPGFVFQPVAKGVNIVIGPNASGKSSLNRALAHLLQPQKGDPPALSLEARFDSDGTVWQARRSGSQVIWFCNGAQVPTSPPALPAAGQMGMYRLAMEHLLTDDQGDREIAKKLLHTLHGGFDLGEPRIALTAKFASNEAKKLTEEQKARREVERNYKNLRQQEAKLPALGAAIAAAENAQSRRERLNQAIDLHYAIRKRKNTAEKLKLFPLGMGQLRGNEGNHLEELEKRIQDLRANLQEQENNLRTHQAELKRTGLEESRPEPEETAANEARLQRIRDKSIERESLEQQLTAADVDVRDAIAQLNGHELAPSLNAESIQRSEAVAAPLLLAQTKRRELKQQLSLVGTSPEQPEIDRHRQGVNALRKWLAITADASDESQKKSAWHLALPLWMVLVATAFAGVAAYLQNAFAAVAGAAVSFATALWALLGKRRTKIPSSSEEAKRSFIDTGLEPPVEWIRAKVREHLLGIEDRLSTLLLQEQRAANAEGIRNQIADVEGELAQLNEQKEVFIREIGFDPELPITNLPLFVARSVQWSKARREHAQRKAEIERLDGNITEAAKQIGGFIAQWSSGEISKFFSPNDFVEIDVLSSAFYELKQCIADASQAQSHIEIVQKAIHATQHQIVSARDDINKLFRDAGLSPDGLAMSTNASGGGDEWTTAKQELVRRIETRNEWRSATAQLTAERTTENNIRLSLRDHKDLDGLAGTEATDEAKAERQYLAKCLRWARAGAAHQLERERDESATQASKLENLREQRTQIRTVLDNAGQDRALENALSQEMRAQAVLEDRRDNAFLSEATNFLLDDVKQAFQAEHEPEVLRRARKLFAEVTSRAFDFDLGDNGEFIAQDNKQEAPRTLAELSCGTRMQLLLALRLAWMQTQERGASPLPLFLDEALTTSDEERFAVMAQSLERVSESEDRQIFYLSARRHELALWRQATGKQPAVSDLAAIRFRAEGAEPDDYKINPLPSVPAPDGQSPETYAALLGVPQYDPGTAAGGIHPFHLLRDDLNLLHRLMDTWHTKSLGQLQALLKSSAAQDAIGDANHRQRLLNRCAAACHWVELCRQGRGKPVDRSALQQSGAVSENFIDKATDLAGKCNGDAQCLISALRDGRLAGFWKNKMDELEQWFEEKGYIDNQPLVSAADQRRLVLLQIKPESNAQAADISQLVDWLAMAFCK